MKDRADLSDIVDDMENHVRAADERAAALLQRIQQAGHNRFNERTET